MIASLRRYVRFFGITFFARRERKHLLRDAADWFVRRKFLKAAYSPEQKEQALSESISWLQHAQDKMKDSGFGTYYITDGWTSSYPETSGYIIPTLLEYDHAAMRERCVAAAEWLLSIQKPGGGWQSLYVDHQRPEVVFNTGQVLRGLVAVYEETGEKRYLDAAAKACDWLASVQEEDGSWQKYAFMKEKRVYDSYVDHPMLMVWKHTGNEKYREAAVRNLDWIITEKQQANGWFADCDNTVRNNDRPILHTISYTIDGLINSGLMLGETKYVLAGKKAADKLLDIFNRQGWLQGRWDADWNGSEYMICTGCAQISIVWLTLYEVTLEEKYLLAASKMNDLLIFVQQRNYRETADTRGALTGSYPLWGKYEPFGFPNWATKYFADALLAERKMKNLIKGNLQ